MLPDVSNKVLHKSIETVVHSQSFLPTEISTTIQNNWWQGKIAFIIFHFPCFFVWDHESIVLKQREDLNYFRNEGKKEQDGNV